MQLHQPKIVKRVELPLSKSECNRWLILRDLFPDALEIPSLSDANDTQLLASLLAKKPKIYDCGNAGTVFRFLTARLCILPGSHIVTGSKRLRDRPIKPLVDALLQLGARIRYLEQDGFAPLEITGAPLTANRVNVDNRNSSQFTSALMLIAPAIPNGMHLECRALGVSAPYMYMTAKIVETLGAKISISGSNFHIHPLAKSTAVRTVYPEPDWSNASYGYGLVLLGTQSEVYFPRLKRPSFQGDALVADYFGQLGIDTIYTGGGVRIRMAERERPQQLRLNLSGTPDLAQTLIVAAAAIGIPFTFHGLHTLRLKETDRLAAMQTELQKVGIHIEVDDDHAHWDGKERMHPPLKPFATYDDHRMAMALSMLAARFPIDIQSPEVVNKSFPNFYRVYFGKGEE